MQDQQKTPGEQISIRGGLNFLFLLVSGHATCFTPFLHRDFGSEALGVNGIAALVIILFYMAHTGSPGMESFLCVWLFMMLMQRIRTAMLCRQGCVIHSRYDGCPWLAMKVVKNETAARSLEPFICAVAGIFLIPYDQATGMFVLAGWVSMVFKMATERRIDQVSLQRLHDAEIEQSLMVQRKKNGFRNY